MENGENVSNQELIIEGPEVLNPEQNLYDQVPFDKITSFQESIKGHDGKPVISLEQFRGIITKIATRKDLTDRSPMEIYRDNLQRYRLKPEELFLFYKYTPVGKYPVNQTDARLVGPAILSCIDALEKTPYWDEYIAKALSDRSYLPDGNVFNRPGYRETAKGFGEWLKAKLERVQKIKSSAIIVLVNEAFDSSSQQVLTQSGRSSKNRRYRFLNVENLRVR